MTNSKVWRSPAADMNDAAATLSSEHRKAAEKLVTGVVQAYVLNKQFSVVPNCCQKLLSISVLPASALGTAGS